MPLSTRKTCLFTALAIGAIASGPVHAEEPGRGLTAHFEIAYLKLITDHHFSALRMTELAAGTDTTRDPGISPMEGTSPTPDKPPVQAKASSEAKQSGSHPGLSSLSRGKFPGANDCIVASCSRHS